MLKQYKAADAPAIFTKGMLRYKQGRFDEARKLILKAGRWMDELRSDALYKAALLLVESKFGSEAESVRYKAALEALADSPYKDTTGYAAIIQELRRKAMEVE